MQVPEHPRKPNQENPENDHGPFCPAGLMFRGVTSMRSEKQENRRHRIKLRACFLLRLNFSPDPTGRLYEYFVPSLSTRSGTQQSMIFSSFCF
jgi:hypothetical protein